MTRIPVPDDIAAEILFQHDHTCCVCNEAGRSVQIHHIDEIHSNNDPANLAILCLADHDATQLQGGFGRKLSAREVVRYRDDWTERVRQRRTEADRLAVSRMSGASLPQVTSDTSEWSRPSDELLTAYIESLPHVLKEGYLQAQKLWDAGNTRSMINGNRLIIDILEQSWVHLAAWFAPHHFLGRGAAEYFSNYIASRYAWNYAMVEPEAPGSRGSEARLMYVAETMVDIEEAVAEAATTLGENFVDGFDRERWLARWKAAKE